MRTHPETDLMLHRRPSRASAIAACGLLLIAAVAALLALLSGRMWGRWDEAGLQQAVDAAAEAEELAAPLFTEEQYESLAYGMTYDAIAARFGKDLRRSIDVTDSVLSPRRDLDFVAVRIEGRGKATLVFIDDVLVARGGKEGMLNTFCAVCIRRLGDGARPVEEGIPRFVDGNCPVCGGTELFRFFPGSLERIE